MAEAITIRLGDRAFTVRPLAFRQIREIERALADAFAAGPLAKFNFDTSLAILAAALSRATPELTPDEILDLEVTTHEIAAATRAILVLSGFIERKESALGEAAAGN